MAAGDDQRQEGRLQIGILEQIGKDMPFHVIHRDERLVQRPGRRLGCRHAHEERPHQTGALRHGDGIHVVPGAPRLAEGLLRHGQHVLDMMAGCDLRHHAAEFFYGSAPARK